MAQERALIEHYKAEIEALELELSQANKVVGQQAKYIEYLKRKLNQANVTYRSKL